MSLERRYRRLLWAYPAAYRAQRGEEIVGTYLELAGPGRRWPGARDSIDVLAGGFRERLRANGAERALDGLRLAATHPFGPFGDLGALPDICWILAALAAAPRPASWLRITRALQAGWLDGWPVRSEGDPASRCSRKIRSVFSWW